MTFKEKCLLVEIHNAINQALGDSDPMDDYENEGEFRKGEPLVWACQKIAGLIGGGSWDKYVIKSALADKDEDEKNHLCFSVQKQVTPDCAGDGYFKCKECSKFDRDAIEGKELKNDNLEYKEPKFKPGDIVDWKCCLYGNAKGQIIRELKRVEWLDRCFLIETTDNEYYSAFENELALISDFEEIQKIKRLMKVVYVYTRNGD